MAELGLNKIEEKIQAFWEKEKIFLFNKESKKPVFSIDTPPPTVSGVMHMGHAFGFTQADFIARYRKMQGHELFYPFGFDDNGLATALMVEKSRGIKQKNFSRNEFIKIVLEETKKAEKVLENGFKRIGLACDWSLLYRTIDDYCRKQAQRSFLDIYNKGRVYQREAPTMWCPSCQTAIAQAELEDSEKDSTFHYLEFDTVNGKKISIATTRPELMPACVAIHVHPDDKRYRKFVGDEVKIPFTDRTVKVYENTAAQPEFGTGAVYHCTFGDLDDVAWIMETGLPIIEIVGKDGIFNEKAGKYAGLSVEDARKAVVEDLKKEGRIKKQEPIRHVVNAHERCKTPIEIITAKQWFVKYLDLKDDFIAKAKQINWHPKYMKSRYDNWIHGLKWDWNISRQRYYGIPFPVWYCKKCGEVMIADEKQLPVDPLAEKPGKKCKCGSSEFEGEKDTFDTWFTSSLTPQISCKWKEDEKFFRKMFPMSLRPQGHDIICLWAFNTIVKGLLHENRLPWKSIMVNGWALDPKGKKMSKSLGNVIEPQKMIQKYCADALRYWAGSSSLGEDVPFQEKEMLAGKKLVTKLYNASRFVKSIAKELQLQKADLKKLELSAFDEWVLSRLNSVKKEATAAFEEYNFARALSTVRNFFWLEFADFYIEEAKHRVYGKEEKTKKAAEFVLLKVMWETLLLFAPFLSHSAEEIAQKSFKKLLKGKSIHQEKWPAPDERMIDEKIESRGAKANAVVAALRKFKSSSGMPLNRELKKVKIFGEAAEELEAFLPEVKGTMKAVEITVATGNTPAKAIEACEGIFLEVQA